MKFKFISLDVLVLIFIGILGLFQVFTVPPFQKPDEVIHFKYSSAIAVNDRWLNQSRYMNFPDKVDALKLAHKFEEKFMVENVFYKDESEAKEILPYDKNWNSYITYFPSYLGIWFGGLTDYPAWAFYGGRLFGFIFFGICLIVSTRLAGKYKWLIYGYAVLPMVLQQSTIVGYDVMLCSLSPILFGLTINLLERENMNWKIFAGLMISTLLYVMVKPGYYLVVLLPMIVLWMKTKKYILKKPVVIAAIVLMIVIGGALFVKKMMISTEYNGEKLISGKYQMEILKDDPGYFTKVLADTWEAKRVFYIESSLGYFGWLDYRYDLYGYLLVFGLFLYLCSHSFGLVKKNILDWLSIIMVLGMVIGSYVLIHFMFWLYWTEVGSSVVEGVQGRYLLPLMPFLIWLLLEIKLKLGQDKIKMIFLSLLLLLIGIDTYEIIYKRYYDFSKNIANANELAEGIQNLKDEEEPLEKIDSRNKMVKYFDTSWEDKVIGFQIAIEKDDGLIRVPYRYKIMDEEGKKVLLSGYLTQKKLQDNGVYETTFDKAFEPKGKVVALVIEPVVLDEKEKYFSYLSLYDEIQGRLLFIKSN